MSKMIKGIVRWQLLSMPTHVCAKWGDNQRLVVLFPSHFLIAKLGLRERKFEERELGLHVKNKGLVIFVCSRFLRSY